MGEREYYFDVSRGAMKMTYVVPTVEHLFR